MKKSLDIMSVIGWVIGAAVLIMGIVYSKDTETGAVSIDVTKFINFIDVPSLLITGAGTFAMLMVSFPLKQFTKMPKHLLIVLMPKQFQAENYIQTLVDCAQKARVNGLLALEEDINNMEDPFLKSSLMMVVDSVDPEKVKIQLAAQMDYLDDRHGQERSFYDKGAALAPAFGMLGTLVGLVNMMKTLDNPETVGPNMAVALLTTFYGSIMANVLFTPISNKLAARHNEEYLCRQIICEGVQAIQEGENPKFVQNRLMQLLPQYQQDKFNKSQGGGEEKPA